MNADAHGPREGHLDLQDLIAEAAGQPLAQPARAHLVECETCRREAERWEKVAKGVRGYQLEAAAETAPLPPQQWPRRERPRPTRRNALLVIGSAAAAVVLLLFAIGELAGYVHVGPVRSGGETAAFSAVTGCSQLQQTEGTLESVSGDSLVVAATGGQSVTVNTSPSTSVSVSGPLLADITEGATTVVSGTSSNGTIQATTIFVGPHSSDVTPPGPVSVEGSATGVTAAGFTVRTSAGDQVPVATSSATLVVLSDAGLSDLTTGSTVFAIGQLGRDGTLSATGVAAITQVPSGGRHLSVSVGSCAASSIQGALLRISSNAAKPR